MAAACLELRYYTGVRLESNYAPSPGSQERLGLVTDVSADVEAKRVWRKERPITGDLLTKVSELPRPHPRRDPTRGSIEPRAKREHLCGLRESPHLTELYHPRYAGARVTAAGGP